MSAGAGSFACEDIGSGHDPVEGRVIVQDVFDQCTEIGKQLADLFLALGQTPFWKEDLRVFSEQIENASACRSHAFFVECFQVFQRYRFALFVRHRLFRNRYVVPLLVIVRERNVITLLRVLPLEMR